MLKQGLELKQTQKLSPLQIQTIKLIELPVQELEQRIRKELEENPVLDEDVPMRMIRMRLQEKFPFRITRRMIPSRATGSAPIITIQRRRDRSTTLFQ